ncbi:PREDICTED: basic proline-rich protein-like [Pseudopodoces humilis]|uniref:basic proline-rich protein-like n=1 Tax=Pseudopodoces humilis TaxID=181119 RepID=UPI0006B873BA|nr:PREDICTED: basic proline-rich protein-like [Pseudopodoces humilis]
MKEGSRGEGGAERRRAEPGGGWREAETIARRSCSAPAPDSSAGARPGSPRQQVPAEPRPPPPPRCPGRPRLCPAKSPSRRRAAPRPPGLSPGAPLRLSAAVRGTVTPSHSLGSRTLLRTPVRLQSLFLPQPDPSRWRQRPPRSGSFRRSCSRRRILPTPATSRCLLPPRLPPSPALPRYQPAARAAPPPAAPRFAFVQSPWLRAGLRAPPGEEGGLRGWRAPAARGENCEVPSPSAPPAPSSCGFSSRACRFLARQTPLAAPPPAPGQGPKFHAARPEPPPPPSLLRGRRRRPPGTGRSSREEGTRRLRGGWGGGERGSREPDAPPLLFGWSPVLPGFPQLPHLLGTARGQPAPQPSLPDCGFTDVFAFPAGVCVRELQLPACLLAFSRSFSSLLSPRVRV